jgi:hypothetical protein
MPKKINKKKQTNPLLKDLEIEEMNSTQVEEEINKNEKLMNDFIQKCKYPEAEKCNQKIDALKKILKEKKTSELTKRHTVEKENLKVDEYSEVNNLNFLWSQKFEELQSRSKAALDELKKNQELEIQKLFSSYQEETPEVKPSSMYLKLQKEEEGLVKLRKFKEAETVRKRKEAQRKIDISKSGKSKEDTLKNLEKKLKQKHSNELLYLQKKYQAEYEALTNGKNKEMEFLNKKYSVKKKDLVKQQIREDNINNNKNYGNRIAKLHSNYEQRYTTDKTGVTNTLGSEAKIDSIYAEVNNKNLGDANLASEEKKENVDEINKEEKVNGGSMELGQNYDETENNQDSQGAFQEMTLKNENDINKNVNGEENELKVNNEN